MSTDVFARPLFSSAEAARLLQISTDTLRKAEQAGRIPPARREAGGDDRIYDAQDIATLRAYFKK